ncbi:hypothetical protein HanPI659440_Chr10g0373151 [Helianthus annuus]|nr:hypothetical protein HanPI659440_Chr10g0373151 [Helianthus annuus]
MTIRSNALNYTTTKTSKVSKHFTNTLPQSNDQPFEWSSVQMTIRPDDHPIDSPFDTILTRHAVYTLFNAYAIVLCSG